MQRITNIFKSKYYQFTPGEFLPIYRDGELANKREFHTYRIKQILNNRRAFWYQLTHQRG